MRILCVILMDFGRCEVHSRWGVLYLHVCLVCVRMCVSAYTYFVRNRIENTGTFVSRYHAMTMTQPQHTSNVQQKNSTSIFDWKMHHLGASVEGK